MTLTKTLHLSTITNSPVSSSVTFKGETFNVYKCIIDSLESLVLPRPSLSQTLYQGGVIVHDTLSNTFGYFLLVTANPSNTTANDPLGNVLTAREVWLAKPQTGFIDTELQRAAVS